MEKLVMEKKLKNPEESSGGLPAGNFDIKVSDSKKSKKFKNRETGVGVGSSPIINQTNSYTPIPKNTSLNVTQLSNNNITNIQEGLTVRQPLISNAKIDEEQLEKIMNDYQPFRDKFLEIYLEFSRVKLATPTRIYCNYSDEYSYTKLPFGLKEDFKKIIQNYFFNNKKNPVELFNNLGEHFMYVSLYEDQQIFDLFIHKDLSCSDPGLAKFLNDKEAKEEEG